jgi:flagellar basal-body rod protein FlgB
MRFLDSIFDRTVGGLSKAMDLSWRKNKVLTANVANAETPKYKAVSLQFGNELEQAFQRQAPEEMMIRTDPKHLEISTASTAKYAADLSGITKPDGNNVDIDRQMVSLAQNSSDYANAAQLIRRQIGLVRTAIREGR